MELKDISNAFKKRFGNRSSIMAFSEGDRVIVDCEMGIYEGKVIKVADYAYHPLYTVQLDIGNILHGCKEDELIALDEKKYNINPKCDCGARHTSRPDFHLDWCTLYGDK